MKKNLLKLIFVGLLATIFTSCGSSGSSTAVVDDNSTAEAQAELDRLEAERVAAEEEEAARLQEIEDARIAAEKAEADRLAAEKAEADRLAQEAADANETEEPVTNGNWKILPF